MLRTVLLFAGCLGCFPTSTAREIPIWPPEWREFVASNICDGSQLERGLCRNSRTADVDRCSCDLSCKDYGSCCVDATGQSDPGAVEDHPWHCVEIDHSRTIYALATCPLDYDDAEINDRCVHSSHNIFYNVPYYSTKRGLYYANVYCAVCNGESVDEDISIKMICPSDNSRQHHGYLSLTNCTFEHDVSSVNQEGLKSCSNTLISSCSLAPGSFVAELCPTYMYPVYSTKSGNTYKNFDCAVCNGVDPSELTCQQKTVDAPNPSEQSNGAASSETLTLKVKAERRSPASGIKDGYCRPDQFYDPDLKTCVTVTCPLGYTWMFWRCIRDDGPKPENLLDRWNNFFAAEFISETTGSAACKSRSSNTSNLPGQCRPFPFSKEVNVETSCIDQLNNSATHYQCRDSFCNNVFVVNKCPPEWPNDDTKTSCESDLHNVNTPGLERTYVYSKRLGVFYQNVYCARCHEDVQEFRVKVRCPLTQNYRQSDAERELFKMTYDRTSRRFTINEKGTIRDCTVLMPTEDLEHSFDIENMQFCDPTSTTCMSRSKTNQPLINCEQRHQTSRVTANVKKIHGLSTSNTHYDCFAHDSDIVCSETFDGDVKKDFPDKTVTTFVDIRLEGQSGGGGDLCTVGEFHDRALGICVPESNYTYVL